MNPSQSDALVFFGATGDLAYKKIFPSLQAMLKRGNLKVPVINMDRLAAQLQKEGADSFVKSWEEMMDVVAKKALAYK